MSNVISLKRPTDSLSGRTRGNSDKRLIEECVSYAQSVAAFAAGFDADPDGNNVYAEKIGGHDKRAAEAIEKIAGIAAKTTKGLQAKARIVPMVLKDSEGNLRYRGQNFVLSFAADVKAFLQPIIDSEGP